MIRRSKSALILGILLIANTAYACTPPKSDYKTVRCTSDMGVYFAIRDDGRPVALLDKKGKKTADLFAYDDVLFSQLREGLLPVRKGKKIGYISTHGKVVIPLIYDSLGGTHWARTVNDGRIVVKKSGAFGVIDNHNKTIFAFDKAINNIQDYQGKRALVQRGTERFYINRAGKRIGTAEQSSQSQNIAPSSDILWQDGIHGSEPIFIPKAQNGKWGFVDSQGNAMIIFAFDEVRPFHMGLAGVRQGTHWGFINQAGELVIDFRFDDAGIIPDSTHAPDLNMPFVFINGRAWIGNLHDGTKLCINPQGINIDC